MRFSLLLGCGILPLALAAQLDRMYQPSLHSAHQDVLRTSSGHWWFAGSVYGSPFFYRAVLRKLDDDGLLLHEVSYEVPGHEYTAFYHLAELPDGTLIAAGGTSPGCDFGPFRAFVAACTPDGVPLWQRQFGLEPVASLLVNDTAIMVSGRLEEGGDALLFLSHTGDSLHQITLADLGWNTHVTTAQDGFLAIGHEGIGRMQPDGTITHVLSGSAVDQAVEFPSGQVAVLMNDSLLLLTAYLERTGTGVPLDPGMFNLHELLLHGDDLVFTGMETILRWNSALDPIGATAWDHPNGYYSYGAAIHGNTVMSCGTFTSGATGAALRSIPLDTPLPLPMDIALRGLMVDSNAVHPGWGQNGPYITGQFWINGWIVNEGALAVDHVIIEQLIPYGICGPVGHLYAHGGLSLAPGDSVPVISGPFSWYGTGYPESTPATREFCIWVSCPDERLDRDRSNNEACVEVHVPVGMEELAALQPPAVHPNPAATELFIGLAHWPGEAFGLDLLDPQSRLVVQHAAMGGAVQHLPLPDIAPGAYLLRITTAERQWTVRVMKQ